MLQTQPQVPRGRYESRTYMSLRGGGLNRLPSPPPIKMKKGPLPTLNVAI